MARNQDPRPMLFGPTGRRVRVEFNGEIIADTPDAMILRENAFHIYYYFPVDHVKTEYLTESDHVNESKFRGNTKHWTVKVGDKEAEHAAFTYPETKEGRPDVREFITFEWGEMDKWYEEDEEVFGHPRDPYHRIDTVQSSRNIRVEVDGVTVADTNRSIILYETGMPRRYYMPMEDVKQEYLTATELQTLCPYKGFANYWSVKTNGNDNENVVWGYPEAFTESARIEGYVSFYNEKLDIYVDGELEEKPRTVFG